MSAFERLLKQEAKLERYTRREGGQAAYQPPEMVKCRIQKGVARQLSGQMAQFTSNTKMFMVGAPVPVGSRVVYGGTEFKVGDCQEKYTTSLHHLELMLV